MVDISNNAGIAFSTIFTSRKNFTENDLKLDSRMIQGLGPQGVKSISKGAHITRLGTFLNQDPEDLATKVSRKSAKQLFDIQKSAKKSFEYLQETINKPNLVIEDAIYQCFEFLDVKKEKIRRSKDSEGTQIFSTRDYSHVLAYRSDKRNNQTSKVNTKVSDNRIYSYNIDWNLKGITGSKWADRVDKAAAWTIESSISLAIPGIGGVIGGFTRKKFEKMKDQELTDEINDEIGEIFFRLLRSNLAIEYISYGNWRLSHSSVVHR